MTQNPSRPPPPPQGTRPTLEDSVRPYFAYSTTLDPAGMASVLGTGLVAEALDVEIIYDQPSATWGGRIAGLASQKGQSVYGLFFEVPVERWPRVRKHEAETTGASEECTVWVRLPAEGRVIQATAFTTAPSHSSSEGQVSERFVDALVEAAARARLPESYLEKLTAESLILKRIQGFRPSR
jgi:hypothetical protein